ncbi:MAG: DUF309 domain-containing protein [Epsilonproteobacteria bacterium]|nr:DUF309 domain-containing protein [Campylobacterota bacterium]
MNRALQQFQELLDAGLYYEAHEALEAFWFPKRFLDCNETRLLKGFINASVSFELHKRGRMEQSRRVWRNYLKYRPKLLHLTSKHKNAYYQLSRHIESIALKVFYN